MLSAGQDFIEWMRIRQLGRVEGMGFIKGTSAILDKNPEEKNNLEFLWVG